MKPKIHLVGDESDWIVAEVPNMPGCVSQGHTEAEALANILEAMAAWRLADELKRTDDPLESV